MPGTFFDRCNVQLLHGGGLTGCAVLAAAHHSRHVQGLWWIPAGAVFQAGADHCLPWRQAGLPNTCMTHHVSSLHDTSITWGHADLTLLKLVFDQASCHDLLSFVVKSWHVLREVDNIWCI